MLGLNVHANYKGRTVRMLQKTKRYSFRNMSNVVYIVVERKVKPLETSDST